MIKHLIWCVLLFAAVLITGCGAEKKPDVLTASQKEILSFLPSETQFVLYMNLTELRKTEFWKDYFAQSLTRDTLSSWLSDFEKKTGTGLNKGIAEVVSATTWDGNDLFGVRFEDKIDKVKSYFEDETKFIRETQNGKEVFVLKDKSNARFYFPGDDLLLILKNEEYLSELLAGSNKKFDKGKPLYTVIEKIKNKDHYWMATTKGGFAAGLLNLLAGGKELPVKKLISSVNRISLSAHFSDGVDIYSVWGCTDSKNAYLLSTGVRSALAMDLLAGKDYALNQLLKKLEIDREEQDVLFEININKDELAGIKKLAEKKKLSQKL